MIAHFARRSMDLHPIDLRTRVRLWTLEIQVSRISPAHSLLQFEISAEAEIISKRSLTFIRKKRILANEKDLGEKPDTWPRYVMATEDVKGRFWQKWHVGGSSVPYRPYAGSLSQVEFEKRKMEKIIPSRSIQDKIPYALPPASNELRLGSNGVNSRREWRHYGQCHLA